MKAEIIATGTELLLGEITDTNTPFLAGQLAGLGIDLYYTATVGDNYERMLGLLRQAWQRSDLIILTGGLGPTQGDITRDVIAGLFGENPQVDPALKEELVSYFTRVGMEMPLNNLKQATLIPSAQALSNRRGTAPGWWVEKDGRIIISLPGPPGENQAMWKNEVLPRLEKRAGAVIVSRTLKTLGLSEGRVDDLVSPFLKAANPTLGIYAKSDGIHLRITAKATDRETARTMLAGREAEIRGVLNDHVWGADDDTPEGVLAQLLRDDGLTVAVAESFTVGLLACTLAGAPGSADFFKGGLVATSAESRALLDVGPVRSPESAATMARAVRARLGAAIGIGLDGYGSLPDDPNTGRAYIAIDGGPGRELNQTYSARFTMMTRRAIAQTMFRLRSLLLRGGKD